MEVEVIEIKKEKEEETTNYVVQEGYTISKGTVYLSVDHFFLSLGLFVTVLGAVLGVMWTKLTKQIDDSSTSDQDITDKIEERDDKLYKHIENKRLELKKDIEKNTDRIWDLKDDICQK